MLFLFQSTDTQVLVYVLYKGLSLQPQNLYFSINLFINFLATVLLEDKSSGFEFTFIYNNFSS